MAPASSEGDRRQDILEAAIAVFVRYGYRKTSMDEVARAAGLSRQGLYLYFRSKKVLFREGVSHLLATSAAAARAALDDDDLDLVERIAQAHEAVYGPYVETLGGQSSHAAELLEAAALLVGGVIEENAAVFVAAVAACLEEAGVPERWADLGATATELASTLDAASIGLKHSAGSLEAYGERLRLAVRLICREPGMEQADL